VKLQVTGPWSLARALTRDGAAAAPHRLARELGAWIAANALGCIADVRACGAEVLLVADEPALGADAGAAAIAAWEPLRTVAPVFGVHVCGAPPWAVLAAAAPDVLFLDLHRFGPDDRALEVLARLIAGGVRIGLGVVPVTAGDGPTGSGEAAAERWIAGLAAAGVAPADLAAAALVTPACGTGPETPEVEREIAAATAMVAGALAGHHLDAPVRGRRSS
jgi:hypothetical protein